MFYVTDLALSILTLILLTWKLWWAPNNASKWQVVFNSAFKGLNTKYLLQYLRCLFIYLFYIRKISKIVRNLRKLLSYHFNKQNSSVSLCALIVVLIIHITSVSPRKSTKWSGSNKTWNAV